MSMTMRTGDWKVVSNENRGEAFGVWMEPFVDLRVPLIFNLRRDPYERAQHNANGYYNWMLERVYITYLAADSATKFLLTLKDFPPSQLPGSFNLDAVRAKIEATRSRGN
jgi:arylsulfatase